MILQDTFELVHELVGQIQPIVFQASHFLVNILPTAKLNCPLSIPIEPQLCNSLFFCEGMGRLYVGDKWVQG